MIKRNFTEKTLSAAHTLGKPCLYFSQEIKHTQFWKSEPNKSILDSTQIHSLYKYKVYIYKILIFFCHFFQNLAAAAAAGGIGVRPSFATGMAGIPHAATGLSLQAAIANQAAYGQALPAT